MKVRRSSESGTANRRGLAPVELVLALPVWLLLASAMVIVGNLGAWKIRGHLAVREAAMRARWPRTRATEPNTAEWSRSSAIMRSRPPTSSDLKDSLAEHAVIRGPEIVSPTFEVIVPVDPQVMETRSHTSVGEAFLNEPPAVWPRSGVRNRFAREFPILDGKTGQWAPSKPGSLRCRDVWTLPVFE